MSYWVAGKKFRNIKILKRKGYYEGLEECSLKNMLTDWWSKKSLANSPGKQIKRKKRSKNRFVK